MDTKKCETKGCSGRAKAHGRCARCYMAIRRGTTPGPKKSGKPKQLRYLAMYVDKKLALSLVRLARRQRISTSAVLRAAATAWVQGSGEHAEERDRMMNEIDALRGAS